MSINIDFRFIFFMTTAKYQILLNTLVRRNEYDKNIDNPLEKRLAAFAADKSKENYVSLLYAFRYTDVLVPAAVQNDPELPFGNAGVLKHSVFKPDIVYFNSLNKRLMPVFRHKRKFRQIIKQERPFLCTVLIGLKLPG